MKHNDKPSLDELFQSKKLDVPSDDFWDDFQDRVLIELLLPSYNGVGLQSHRKQLFSHCLRPLPVSWLYSFTFSLPPLL